MRHILQLKLLRHSHKRTTTCAALLLLARLSPLLREMQSAQLVAELLAHIPHGGGAEVAQLVVLIHRPTPAN